MKVYLDVDGVLCDFVRGVNAFFGTEYSYTKYPYDLGKWDILDDIAGGIGFKVVNAICTENFWVNLPWMWDGYSLYQRVMTKFDDVSFLTTPMPNAESWTGRFKWLEKHTGPSMAGKITITRESKAIVANPDSLLIDDRDKNVDEFRAAGGDAILVPRPWNRLHKYRHKTFEYVDMALREIVAKEKV